ncbi:oxygen-independent coproporphyrinogen III oxidase [Tritonibacter horizontis]|uniref:Coproporphyrinogen-III oxidase n=1 Tax=Tritonibacter horizontis TaxID=1768241 RepID=A0A132BS07_9RHOB|nr:oxygen-independent coproporphyrinogen III oxidase [Tritonibacter horizontis]KUP91179.1 oxygen-independent coproporphyrinogen-III oxidase [Tritonibacter horizontis]
MTHKSQLARYGLFDTKVPRYTSYPATPHFQADCGSDQFEHWIEAIEPGSQISLYLHVPFCRRLCWFCACRTQGTRSDSPVRNYVDVLKQELTLLTRHLPAGVTLSRLHWGGGTPTLLSPDLMTDLAERIFKVAPMAPGGEFSVEIDPNEIDAPRLDALVQAGLTRASIGIQDFDPQIQKTIGRIQPYDLTRDVVEMIRARGVHSLNADILFGLPHQTRGRMMDTVQKLLSLAPDRVALYGYAHVPWMARRQSMIPSDVLPNPQDRLQLYDAARQLFLWDGYQSIGIDHFAVPHDRLAVAARQGRLRRNFQGYTDDSAEVLIGLGASSISRFPQGYAQNTASTSTYNKTIRYEKFATVRGHVFTGEDRLRGRLIEALMCDFAISTKDILSRFTIEKHQLAALFDSVQSAFPGLLEVSETGLRIKPEAKPLTRVIARHFDLYTQGEAGHSSAI